jgi:hypothetical protein
LVIRIPNLEIFLFCQHNSTGGGNLELRQTILVNFYLLNLLCTIFNDRFNYTNDNLTFYLPRPLQFS